MKTETVKHLFNKAKAPNLTSIKPQRPPSPVTSCLTESEKTKRKVRTRVQNETFLAEV